MADNDSSIIKSVEGLQNITGLSPARRREERKRRQNMREQREQESEEQLNESFEEQVDCNESTENGENQHTIDYCA